MENSAVATELKKSVFIPVPKEINTKKCSNYRTIALISQASKVMLKSLQARLQQYVNHELPDVQAGFRKGRESLWQNSTSIYDKNPPESRNRRNIPQHNKSHV